MWICYTLRRNYKGAIVSQVKIANNIDPGIRGQF